MATTHILPLALTTREIKLLYSTLLREDGFSLRPDLPLEEQRCLTSALDKLRQRLFCSADPENSIRSRIPEALNQD